MIIEVKATFQKLHSFLESPEDFGVKDMVRDDSLNILRFLYKGVWYELIEWTKYANFESFDEFQLTFKVDKPTVKPSFLVNKEITDLFT